MLKIVFFPIFAWLLTYSYDFEPLILIVMSETFWLWTMDLWLFWDVGLPVVIFLL